MPVVLHHTRPSRIGGKPCLSAVTYRCGPGSARPPSGGQFPAHIWRQCVLRSRTLNRIWGKKCNSQVAARTWVAASRRRASRGVLTSNSSTRTLSKTLPFPVQSYRGEFHPTHPCFEPQPPRGGCTGPPHEPRAPWPSRARRRQNTVRTIQTLTNYTQYQNSSLVKVGHSWRLKRANCGLDISGVRSTKTLPPGIFWCMDLSRYDIARSVRTPPSFPHQGMMAGHFDTLVVSCDRFALLEWRGRASRRLKGCDRELQVVGPPWFEWLRLRAPSWRWRALRRL